MGLLSFFHSRQNFLNKKKYKILHKFYVKINTTKMFPEDLKVPPELFCKSNGFCQKFSNKLHAYFKKKIF